MKCETSAKCKESILANFMEIESFSLLFLHIILDCKMSIRVRALYMRYTNHTYGSAGRRWSVVEWILIRLWRVGVTQLRGRRGIVGRIEVARQWQRLWSLTL